MKHYFAKYLPVEGEIKVGDMAQANQDSLYGKFAPLLEPLTQAEIDDKEYSKVQLFLCSRDIQAGDKFTTLPNPLGVVSKDRVADTLFMKVLEENPMLPEFLFKVIGPISPQATWVTEGMEFDESDLRMLIKGNTTDWDFDPTYPTDKYPLKHILVKGPCGHFH